MSINDFPYSKTDMHNAVCSHLDRSLNFPERVFLSEIQIKTVVITLMKRYFFIDMSADMFIEHPMTISTRGEPEIQAISQTTTAQYITPGQDEDRFENIHAAVQNYLAAVKVTKELERVAKERNELNELAFTLLKAADPANLKYHKWEHVPRFEQHQWLAVAEKARQVLK